jgi:hypothetical protein
LHGNISGKFISAIAIRRPPHHKPKIKEIRSQRAQSNFDRKSKQSPRGIEDHKYPDSVTDFSIFCPTALPLAFSPCHVARRIFNLLSGPPAVKGICPGKEAWLAARLKNLWQKGGNIAKNKVPLLTLT